MLQEEIQRINELARKAKTPEGLTDAEREEQQQLRSAYIAAFRSSLQQQLDATVIVRPDGTKEAVSTRKKESERIH